LIFLNINLSDSLISQFLPTFFHAGLDGPGAVAVLVVESRKGPMVKKKTSYAGRIAFDLLALLWIFVSLNKQQLGDRLQTYCALCCSRMMKGICHHGHSDRGFLIPKHQHIER